MPSREFCVSPKDKHFIRVAYISDESCYWSFWSDKLVRFLKALWHVNMGVTLPNGSVRTDFDLVLVCRVKNKVALRVYGDFVVLVNVDAGRVVHFGHRIDNLFR